MKAAAAFLVSLAVTAAVTPLVRRLARSWGVLDRPDARKVHSRGDIPRLGGAAMFLGIVAALALMTLEGESTRMMAGLLFGTSLVFLVGVLDDVRGLSPWSKVAVELAAAFVLYRAGLRVDYVTNPFSGQPVSTGYLSFPLTALWMLLITNAVNLLDGLDGLAAGVVAIVAAVMALAPLRQGEGWEASLVPLALGGAALGFLPYNFNPASIFMGDSGSLTLGFTLAAAAVLGGQKGAVGGLVFVPLLALAVPLIDTTFSIVRRVRSGRGIFSPDMGHIHHRMLSLDPGRSQRRVVLTLYGMTGCYGLIALAFADAKMRGVVALASLALVVATSALWLGRILRMTRGTASGGTSDGSG